MVLTPETVDISGSQTWPALPGDKVPGGQRLRFLHSAGTLLVVLSDLHELAPLLPPRNKHFTESIVPAAKNAGLLMIRAAWKEAFGGASGRTTCAVICEVDLILVLLGMVALKGWDASKRRSWSKWVLRLKSVDPEELSAAVTSAPAAPAAAPAPQAPQRRRQQPTARRQPAGSKLKRQDRKVTRKDPEANRQSLLDIARFLASRIKGMPEFGTADDIRVREGASIISKAEKALEKETEQVEWRECDFVIPACTSHLVATAEAWRVS